MADHANINNTPAKSRHDSPVIALSLPAFNSHQAPTTTTCMTATSRSDRKTRTAIATRPRLIAKARIAYKRKYFCFPYRSVSYTHLRAHETPEHLVCRLLLEKKKKK